MRRKFWKVTVIPFGNYLDNSFFSIRVQRLCGPNNDGLDSFLYLHMGKKQTCRSWWKVVADLLILSHDQASVERGFPVNKQLEVQNLQECLFIA